MAVIDGLPGVKVSIRLNDSTEDWGEYDDPDPPQTPATSGTATHSISKFIESQDDTNFSVHFEVKEARRWIQGNRGLVMATYVDGTYIKSSLYRESELKSQVLQGKVGGYTEASDKPGRAILKPFMFTTIKQVEDGGARVTKDLKIAKHLGNVEVVISRVNIQGRTDWKPDIVTSKTELAEKAMKGRNLSHGTGFSGGRDVPMPTYWDLRYPDGEGRLARFIFRYKSKAALQIEGIIPCDPSAESSAEPRPRNAADLPLEDLRRLAQERLDQLVFAVKQESKVGVKRKADDDIKPRMSKVYKTTSDGAIDLTK
ncbi:hypothetical protein LZ30DRAFT_588998 [Colletotrichum cereale]|nr:hypothetical protein LZ30DRAFT_588998 [Colletotrichum cereale]